MSHKVCDTSLPGIELIFSLPSGHQVKLPSVIQIIIAFLGLSLPDNKVPDSNSHLDSSWLFHLLVFLSRLVCDFQVSWIFPLKKKKMKWVKCLCLNASKFTGSKSFSYSTLQNVVIWQMDSLSAVHTHCISPAALESVSLHCSEGSPCCVNS